ncbi:MAG: 30S ribosomal protein S2 [Bacteroidales bacterium]|nr:30S ribosomal protein S2 [Bacteroidales bacterium]
MSKANFDQLLEAGVHFGHLKRKWNPKMAPYIFAEKNGIHIIDLNKTLNKLDEACAAAKQIAKSGRKILFVATKKQARAIVAEQVAKVGMPYVTERWPGGMLTNFATIRKAIKKMSAIDRLMKDKQFESISKRERLQITREKEKLEKNLGSIADLGRLPSAVFIVDINKEHIAVAEARRLNIPTLAMVDTNTNPELIDFPIPANDDASKSIDIILQQVIAAIEEGLAERKYDKEQQKDDEEAADEKERLAVEGMDEEEAEDGKKKTARKKAEGEEAAAEGEEKKEKRPRKVASTGAQKVTKK